MDIHKFEVNGEYILLDVNSGAVHVLDAATYQIMDVFDGTNDAAVVELFAAKFGEEAVREIVAELHELMESKILL